MLRELPCREWILNRTIVLLILGIFAAFNAYSVMETSSSRSIDPATVEAWIKQWNWVGSVAMTLAALVVITISAASSVGFYRTRDC